MFTRTTSPVSIEQNAPTEQNKDAVARFVRAVFEQYDGNALNDLVTAHFHAHPWAPFGIPDGPDGMRQVLAELRAAFSNARVAAEDIVAEGDRVVVRYVFEADHTGELMGVGATGRRVRLPGILIARLEGGKLAEYWREEDQLGLMQQVGMAPHADS